MAKKINKVFKIFHTSLSTNQNKIKCSLRSGLQLVLDKVYEVVYNLCIEY